MTDNCRKNGDRLAVICSGNTKDCIQGKLLSSNMIENGTGEAQSNEVISSIDEWGIRPNVVGIN